MRGQTILALILMFVSFSFTSVGGGTSVLAGIQHQAVDVHHWMSSADFVRIFAISRAAPGPGSMLSTLVGFQAAGLTGAVVATLCMFVPSSLLAYVVMRVGSRFQGRWRAVLEEGLAPVGGGLILAGVVAVARISESGYRGALVALATAAGLWLRPQTHPVVILALGACVFVGLGWIPV